MKTIFKLIPIMLIFCIPDLLYGVGGISNSKVIVPSTDTVPKNRFEFEPFFSFTAVDDPADSRSYGFGARFTYGFLDNLEAGFNLNYLEIEDSDIQDSTSDFGNIEAGLKYRLIDQSDNSPFSLAYQGGVTFPTAGDDEPWVFEPVGLILTTNYTDKLSSDLDVVFSFDEDDNIVLVSNLGLGYFVTEIFQPVVEVSYAYENPDEGQSTEILNGTVGFTSPVNEMLTIILGVTYDLYTDNTDEELTVSAAFTFLF
ncbi:MAG: hypothetical protein GWO07_10205 [Candidatus Dadabacteria bacterium]|nr:hypothetical protein [Candidatus Dadabacteria bacterium]NIS09117.1 hypothetical protein [Candidatus Dadabacteria bacterium]NIV41550.1 hypothetical protein [Candidatus Dadabacteria bacterium]NIX15694.1 hypothetical protein [Candidatus Dadabacteria bacterium]NIY22425.1 hypothetical protein [Candidatus Dadabacteria bacterium]